MSASPVLVRPGLPSDAPAIGRLHVASWRAAYPGIIDEANLAALDPDERAGVWENAMRQGPGSLPGVCLVAEREGAIVGFTFHGPHLELGPECANLAAIYLDPVHFGSGAGRALFEAAAAACRAEGYRQLCLTVLQDNGSAQGFYRAMGMAPDGHAETWTPRGPVRQELVVVRLRLEL